MGMEYSYIEYMTLGVGRRTVYPFFYVFNVFIVLRPFFIRQRFPFFIYCKLYLLI